MAAASAVAVAINGQWTAEDLGGYIVRVAPEFRSITIADETRTIAVPRESRSIIVLAEVRRNAVPAKYRGAA
jgi:hypothetical protein